MKSPIPDIKHSAFYAIRMSHVCFIASSNLYLEGLYLLVKIPKKVRVVIRIPSLFRSPTCEGKVNTVLYRRTYL